MAWAGHSAAHTPQPRHWAGLSLRVAVDVYVGNLIRTGAHADKTGGATLRGDLGHRGIQNHLQLGDQSQRRVPPRPAPAWRPRPKRQGPKPTRPRIRRAPGCPPGTPWGVLPTGSLRPPAADGKSRKAPRCFRPPPTGDTESAKERGLHGKPPAQYCGPLKNHLQAVVIILDRRRIRGIVADKDHAGHPRTFPVGILGLEGHAHVPVEHEDPGLGFPFLYQKGVLHRGAGSRCARRPGSPRCGCPRIES